VCERDTLIGWSTCRGLWHGISQAGLNAPDGVMENLF
jgi:hypothetical protein